MKGYTTRISCKIATPQPLFPLLEKSSIVGLTDSMVISNATRIMNAIKKEQRLFIFAL